MKLLEVMENIPTLKLAGSMEKEISDIQFDSRKISSGGLFVAIRGTVSDGHKFIENVVQSGAAAIVYESWDGIQSDTVTWIKVEDSRKALALMAANFYGHPSKELQLAGVTGTNGKTSTVTLLHQLFSGLGFRCGMLSTIENRIGEQVVASTHTTPDPLAIHALLRKMVEAGCSHAFMEVSSHAIDQERITGLYFKVGVFTNISHDHLDYHKTFDAYIKVKKRFLDELPAESIALSNVDDKRGEVMLQNTRAAKRTFALKRPADIKGKVLENSLQGLHMILDGQDFYSRLIGNFNAYNLLAVYGVARSLGIDREALLVHLSALSAPRGRFEYVQDPSRHILGIVDYAHTPDALEKVLDTILRLKKESAKVLTVVGCGGDRDRTKRPEMARIACQFSDQVILTSDNPRSEEPEAILKEMEAGVPQNALHKVLTISDRKNAIRTACKLAGSGDVILVAGKGHETYQEIKGVRYHFDDLEELHEAFLLKN